MGIDLVLGFFDGVHKAHRAVIQAALDAAKTDVYLITFKDSPSVYFSNTAEYILSRKKSIEKIKDLGIKQVIELDFPKIANKTAEEYLKTLINTYHPSCITTGFNHTFGINKSGNTDFLKKNSDKYNYLYICVPPVEDDNNIVSSTLIKNYLKEGQIEKANSLLESSFILEGNVVKGAQLGRTIGFPTANIEYPENIVTLPYGVYGVNLKINEELKKAIMNWGIKPTVNNVIKPIAEVHILDYSGDLYGKKLEVNVLKRIRSEEKFNSLDELKNQIKKDIEVCLMS